MKIIVSITLKQKITLSISASAGWRTPPQESSLELKGLTIVYQCISLYWGLTWRTPRVWHAQIASLYFWRNIYYTWWGYQILIFTNTSDCQHSTKANKQRTEANKRCCYPSKHEVLNRSMQGENGHLLLSRFSQWIQPCETILFEISFWATLKYFSNLIWRPKSKIAAKLPRIVTFWGSLCSKTHKILLIMAFTGKVRCI